MENELVAAMRVLARRAPGQIVVLVAEEVNGGLAVGEVHLSKELLAAAIDAPPIVGEAVIEAINAAREKASA